MTWPRRHALTARLRAERGAAATIVAVLLGGGVLLGFGALSIDVGNLMWERRQLQNGADAAVLDLARVCGTSSACATGEPNKTDFERLVNANAHDGAGTLSGICSGGAGRPTGLAECPQANAAQLANCPPLPPKYGSGFPYVEARTSTRTAKGETILPSFLAQTITGEQGSSVGACARAAWGVPGPGMGMAPVTISQCEWEKASNLGTNYATPPVYGTGDKIGYGGTGQPAIPWEHEVVLYTHYSKYKAEFPCEHEDTNGRATNGGFSYMVKDGCYVNVTVPDWNLGEDGNTTQCDESDLIGKVVSIPVHWCDTMSKGKPTTGPTRELCNNSGGGKPYYYITGWARFYVSGAKFGGGGAGISGADTNCAWSALGIPGGGNNRCIRGWFTSGVIDTDVIVAPVPGDSSTPGNNFGSIGVVPAG